MRITMTGRNLTITEQIRTLVERRIRFALTRFHASIRSVSVRLTDESGPNGAPARRCQVLVRFTRKGAVEVNMLASTVEDAVSRAADRAGRTVARTLERKRDARSYQRRREDRLDTTAT